ncbi:hypothetical protein ACFIQG_21135 [Comamonas odontotermitis]|uniref:hypothetical protein n=1 Tax=Comamonas odontotermitis TaxID=379895 RepID=UPI0036718491
MSSMRDTRVNKTSWFRCMRRWLGTLFLLAVAGLVQAQGTINTVTGNGQSWVTHDWWNGNWGDFGPATNAQLTFVQGVAVDKNTGILFIADTFLSAIREVRFFGDYGLIRTVVGAPTSWGYSGDGGQAQSAQISAPSDVVVDNASNLYIADTYNHAIRKVDLTTGVISRPCKTPSPAPAIASRRV